MRNKSYLANAIVAFGLIVLSASQLLAQSHINNHLGINGLHYLPKSIFNNLLGTTITPDPNAANPHAIPTADYVNNNSVSFTESNVDIPPPCVSSPATCSSGGGSLFESNGHQFIFSADGGATPYAFQEENAFDISFNMVVTSNDPLNRKGIGFQLNSDPNGTNNVTQFTAQTTDSLFGGSPPGNLGVSGSTLLPNFPFGTLYTDGSTIRVGIIYLPPERTGGGVLVTPGTLEYQVDLDPNNAGGELTTGPLDIDSKTVNGLMIDGGIIDGSAFGFRIQVVADNSSNDFYTATFSDFEILNPLENADFNEDGFVDGLDFLVWQQNVGSIGSGTLATGDANGDTNVNGADLAIWESRYGSTSSVASVSVVPEPRAFVLLATGFVVLPRLKRRRGE